MAQGKREETDAVMRGAHVILGNARSNNSGAKRGECAARG